MKRKTTLLLLTAMITTLFSVGVSAAPTGNVKVTKVKGVKITSVKMNSVKVKWNKVKKAAKYQVKYSTNKTLKGGTTTTSSKTNVTVKKLKAGTKYYFRVRAVSGTNTTGKWSSVKSVKTKSSTKDNKLTRKKGYFNVRVVGDGKTTNLKVNVKFKKNNTADSSQKVTLSYSGINNHGVAIVTSSADTEISESGNYNLMDIGFLFRNPAHYGADITISGNASKECMVNAPGYFGTVNGAGTYMIGSIHSMIAEALEGSVTLNASDVGAIDIKGKSKHATITINLKDYYSGLRVNPNGGSWTHDGKTYTSVTGVNWAGKCGSTIKIENPTRAGYKFTGWTTYEDSAGSDAYGNIKGTTFTFCGEARSLADAKNISKKCYTTLTASWEKQ